MSMNTSTGQSCYQKTQSSTPLAGEQSSSFSDSGAQAGNQKDIPVRQAEPTHSIAAVIDNQQVMKESKYLNEYC